MVLVNEMGVKASPLAVYIPQDGVVVCFLFYVFFFFFGFFSIVDIRGDIRCVRTSLP